MTLDHPSDLQAWQRWQDSRRRLRVLKGRMTAKPAPLHVLRGGPDADLVVVVDAWHASMRAAVAAALAHLPAGRTIVVGPDGVDEVVPWTPVSRTTTDRAGLGAALGGARAVLGSGHFLGPGAAVFEATRGLPFLVSQHGLLTPKAPPLPPGAHLLAWSEADAEFWASGRTDVTWSVTGSQLLEDARARPAPPVKDERPIYLGQLHGAELPFAELADAAEVFCRSTHATYRPHPSELDKRSVRTHSLWRRLNIEVTTDRRPLSELDRPIVSVFSTGVLEAAAAGLPAYVHYPGPPAWLQDLWQRYDMHEYGDSPTPAPPAHDAPAQAVARALIEAAG